VGPFLVMAYLTSVAGGVGPGAAVGGGGLPAPPRDPQPLPYLRDDEDPWGLDLRLEVSLNGEVVSRPPFATQYWTAAQQLAHMTVNGASLRTGDLFASGTVSGPERDQRGSMLELSWNGAEPLALADGSTRTFLEDGDVVTISATAPGVGGGRISLGEVTGRVLPAF
jgi:fumarylacetoacetase